MAATQGVKDAFKKLRQAGWMAAPSWPGSDVAKTLKSWLGIYGGARMNCAWTFVSDPSTVYFYGDRESVEVAFRGEPVTFTEVKP